VREDSVAALAASGRRIIVVRHEREDGRDGGADADRHSPIEFV
jgi:hypothetical protein